MKVESGHFIPDEIPQTLVEQTEKFTALLIGAGCSGSIAFLNVEFVFKVTAKAVVEAFVYTRSEKRALDIHFRQAISDVGGIVALPVSRIRFVHGVYNVLSAVCAGAYLIVLLAVHVHSARSAQAKF